MNKKCICIMDKEFGFGPKIGGFLFSVERGHKYEYYIHEGMYNILGDSLRTYYPILSIFFDDVFVDLSELRDKKLTEILKTNI